MDTNYIGSFDNDAMNIYINLDAEGIAIIEKAEASYWTVELKDSDNPDYDAILTLIA